MIIKIIICDIFINFIKLEWGKYCELPKVENVNIEKYNESIYVNLSLSLLSCLIRI